jgi:hypothetical protein
VGSPGRLPGDANGNATVDIADVLLQLQAAGGLATAISLSVDNADVWPATRDGAVTLGDVVRTWRFVNGLETNLQ